MKCQKVQTLIRRCVGDAAAGLGLHFLHTSQCPFSLDAGHIFISIMPTSSSNPMFYHML